MAIHRSHVRSAVSSILALLITFCGSTVTEAAGTQYALGGGATLPSGAVISVAPGQELANFTQVLVNNTGTGPATIDFSATGTPEGLTVTTTGTPFTLMPRESKTSPLSLRVGPNVVPGEYKITAQFAQTNVPSPSSGGVVYAPAIDANFKVIVSGDSGTVTVRAVAEGSDSPVSGDLTISTVASGPGVPIVRRTGSELTTKLVPGTYAASFNVPGLNTTSEKFTLAKDEVKTVTISVKAVSFFVAAAKPVPATGEVSSVNLVASVKNDIAPIPGPVKVIAKVALNGEQVDEATLGTFDTLKSGLTDVKESYAPESGWQPGTYSFTFQVVTPQFTVTGAVVPTVDISWWTTTKKVIAGVVVMLIIAGGVTSWVVVRRRRRFAGSTGAPPTAGS